MLHRYIVAIGAGCAAALLFVVSAQTSVLAMALAYLAPLPIMIATLGFGLDAGAIAGAISVAALAVLAGAVAKEWPGRDKAAEDDAAEDDDAAASED